MKILVNFKPLNKQTEDYSFVEIFDRGNVLLDLPICVAEFGVHYKTPVLYGTYKGIAMVREEEEVKQLLDQLKVFHFKVDGNRLIEVPEDEAELHTRLPKDTPVDELIYENGEILWAKPVEEDEVNG